MSEKTIGAGMSDHVFTCIGERETIYVASRTHREVDEDDDRFNERFRGWFREDACILAAFLEDPERLNVQTRLDLLG